MSEQSAKFVQSCREILKCDLDVAIDVWKYAEWRNCAKKEYVENSISTLRKIYGVTDEKTV